MSERSCTALKKLCKTELPCSTGSLLDLYLIHPTQSKQCAYTFKGRFFGSWATCFPKTPPLCQSSRPSSWSQMPLKSMTRLLFHSEDFGLGPHPVLSGRCEQMWVFHAERNQNKLCSHRLVQQIMLGELLAFSMISPSADAFQLVNNSLKDWRGSQTKHLQARQHFQKELESLCPLGVCLLKINQK